MGSRSKRREVSDSTNQNGADVKKKLKRTCAAIRARLEKLGLTEK